MKLPFLTTFGALLALLGVSCALAGQQVASMRYSRPLSPSRLPELRAGSGAGGVYLSGPGRTYGYSLEGRHDIQRDPTCNIPVNGPLGTDPSGNLVIANSAVQVYAATPLCGAMVGSFSNQFGTSADVATRNAASGPIYVLNRTSFKSRNGVAGSVSACSLAHGCTAELKSASMLGIGASIAVDAAGNVYMSGYASKRPRREHAVLVVFNAGRPPGVEITAFKNAGIGGLDFDQKGNLVALDADAVWVYSGCPSACSAHGPFPVLEKGGLLFGKVTPDGKQYQIAELDSANVAVYGYHGINGVTYLYSYTGVSSSPGYIAMSPESE